MATSSQIASATKALAKIKSDFNTLTNSNTYNTGNALSKASNQTSSGYSPIKTNSGQTVDMNYDLSPSATTAMSSLGTPITPAALSPTTPIGLPTPTPTTPTAGITAGITAGLGIQDPLEKTDSQIVQETKDLYSSILGEPESLTNEYQKAYKQTIAPAQQEVNNLKSQIGAITAQSNADILSARNQSSTEGGTAGILSAREDAISRSSAIKTLPLAAELASATQNLQLAQDYLDQYFSLRKEDIQREYTYKSNLLASIKEDLTTKEKRQWDLLNTQNEQNFTLKRDNINYAQSLSNTAIANGQPNIATKIGKLDPSSPTFSSDLATYAGQIAKQTVYPSSGTAPGGNVETITTINGKPLNATQATALGYGQRMSDANQTIETLGSQFTGLSSYVSSNEYFPNYLKSSGRQQYEQAQRNFINAALRKESGAAISPGEFDSAAKQYFPQPGDGQAVIAQKTQNRLRKIANLAQEANVTLSSISGNQSNVVGDYNSYLKAIGQ